MCKVGGPRCSTDTRRSRATAAARKTKVDNQVSALEADGQTVPKRLKDRQAATDAKVQKWSELYDSTPDGQAELQQQIENADGKDAQELTTRLQQAKALREAELAAARERKNSNGQHEDESGNGVSLGQGQGGISQGNGADGEHERGGSAGAPGRMAGSQNLASDRRRALLVGGQHVNGTALARPPRLAELQRQGRPAPEVYELDQGSAAGFRDSISALKENNPYAASVYVYDAEEYNGMRLFATDDGKAGFALKGDDIVSVYVRRDSDHRGCSAALMAQAVAQGGRRLDCFDTELPHVYARAGFQPVARIGWNEDYAPEGWNHSLYDDYNGGRPDVVFMAYQAGTEDGRYKPGQGAKVADYDDAGGLIDKFLKGTKTST